jgi:putative peptidoglycan lipid II flippase
MYDIGQIAGALFFVQRFGVVYGLSLGVVVGLALHTIVQFVPAVRLGIRLVPDFDFKFSGVTEIIALALPRIFGLAVTQIDKLVDSNLASFLEVGSLKMRDYAYQLQSMPVDIFGLALATTAFPLMASMAARQDADGFYKVLFRNIRQILYITLPAAVVLIVLRVEIIRLIYGYGRLTWIQTRSVAFTLALFAVSIGAQAVIYILVRAFYALKDTKMPVRASVIAVVINSLLSITFVYFVRHVSMLALSYSIATIINMVLLIYMLQRKIGRIFQGELFASTLKVILATLVMGLVLWPLEHWLSLTLSLERVRYLIIETVICTTVGIVVYVALSVMLKCEELGWVVDLVKDIKHRRVRS